MTRLDEVLGLLALAGYIIGIVGLAAAITWVVIRIFPTERNPKKPDAEEKTASGGAAVFVLALVPALSLIARCDSRGSRWPSRSLPLARADPSATGVRTG